MPEDEITLCSLKYLKRGSILLTVSTSLIIVFIITYIYYIISVLKYSLTLSLKYYFWLKLYSLHFDVFIFLLSFSLSIFVISFYGVVFYIKSLDCFIFNKNIRRNAIYSKLLYILVPVFDIMIILKSNFKIIFPDYSNIYLSFITAMKAMPEFSLFNIFYKIFSYIIIFITFLLSIFLFRGIYKIGKFYNKFYISFSSILYYIPLANIIAPVLMFYSSYRAVKQFKEPDASDEDPEYKSIEKDEFIVKDKTYKNLRWSSILMIIDSFIFLSIFIMLMHYTPHGLINAKQKYILYNLFYYHFNIYFITFILIIIAFFMQFYSIKLYIYSFKLLSGLDDFKYRWNALRAMPYIMIIFFSLSFLDANMNTLFFSMPLIPIFTYMAAFSMFIFFIYIMSGLYNVGIRYKNSWISSASLLYLIPFINFLSPFIIYFGTKKISA